nr:MAG TPA: hypothetical protein [Caudoviricetes sp.]DAW63767.1 MAG TPA: hypothetical protein [Caudoviricetes sp.]
MKKCLYFKALSTIMNKKEVHKWLENICNIILLHFLRIFVPI